jgi:hypothetical protein
MKMPNGMKFHSHQNLPYCSICTSNNHVVWFNQEFAECKECDFIFWIQTTRDVITTPSNYDETYWNMELESAHDRAWGIAVARAAEVILLAKRPILKFIDIGTGSGDFLDAMNHFLPNKDIAFIGIEKYPPVEEHRTKDPGYRFGWLDLFQDYEFDAGICIEVLEHLTVNQVQDLFRLLSLKSNPDSIFLFNTGLTAYVKDEDPSYLDPLVRGHINIWSVKAIAKLVSKYGWQIYEIPNRNWAFVAEKSSLRDENLISRIWNPVQQNLAALKGINQSNLLQILGRDGLRAK